MGGTVPSVSTERKEIVMTVEYKTDFGSLAKYRKGSLEIIKDDPKNYAFSNIFEVASKAKPYEKVAVGKNMEYVLEAICVGRGADLRIQVLLAQEHIREVRHDGRLFKLDN